MVVTGWFTMLIVVLGVAIAIGIPVTIGESLSVLLSGCVPALVLVAVFRGAPPRSISQVLYDLEPAASEAGVPLTHVAGASRGRADWSGPADARPVVDAS